MNHGLETIGAVVGIIIILGVIVWMYIGRDVIEVYGEDWDD